MQVQTPFVGGIHPVFQRSISYDGWVALRKASLLKELGPTASTSSKHYRRDQVFAYLVEHGQSSSMQVVRGISSERKQVGVMLNHLVRHRKVAVERKEGVSIDGRRHRQILFYTAII